LTTFGSQATLLTLGTGFDQNLTGRENIYLNAAYLGFSRSKIESELDAIILRARAVHRGAGLHVLDGDAGAATPASIIAPDSRLGSGFSIGVEM